MSRAAGMTIAGEEESGEVQPNGITAVCFSISAGEGRNIVLRNLIGKVAANLNFLTRMQVRRSA